MMSSVLDHFRLNLTSAYFINGLIVITLFSFLKSDIVAKLSYNLLAVKLSEVVVEAGDKPLNIRLKNDQVKSIESDFLTIQPCLDDDTMLLYHLGQLSFWNENHAKTDKYLSTALHDKPIPLAAMFLAFSFKNNGEIDQAVQIFKEIPGIQSYLTGLALDAEYERNYRSAEDLFQLLNMVEPGWLPADSGYWFARSLNLLNRPIVDEKEAKFIIGQAISLNENSAARQLRLGIELYKAKQLALAEEALYRAEKLDPHSYWPKYYLGLVHFGRGNYLVAQKKLTEVIEMDPDFGRGHHWMARTLIKLGEDDLALASYEKAVELIPEDKNLEYELQAFSNKRTPKEDN